MPRLTRLLLVLPLVVLGCSDDDEDDAASTTTTSEASDASEASTSSTTSTTAPAEATTSTTAFTGGTTPTSAPGTSSGVALLTGVTAETEEPVDRVAFTFREGTPGFAVAYVEPPIRQDGSGEEITVEGEAFLEVRMEPASGVDLSGEEFEETYTGPDRIEANLASVTEVVRTGDFEANLTWVIGLRAHEARYRVEVDGAALTVVLLNAG